MELTRRQFIGSLATIFTVPLAGCWQNNDGSDTLVATVFQAGKADAILIQQGSSAMLVDTGLEENAASLVSAIHKLGVYSLDALVVTHFDRDHVGGAAAILDAFSVRRVLQSNYPRESDEYEAYVAALSAAGINPTTVVNTNTFMKLGEASVVVNGPVEEEYDKEPSNNSSLITSISLGDTNFLLMGDAEKDRIKEFIASYSRPSGALALKVPYHGHTQGQLDELLEAVMPDVAAITNGDEEPEADEIAEVTALLQDVGSEVFLTTNGDITLTFEGSSITAKQ